MLSVVKNGLRPTLLHARGAFAAGRAFKHTLPPLPYAYDVGSFLRISW